MARKNLRAWVTVSFLDYAYTGACHLMSNIIAFGVLYILFMSLVLYPFMSLDGNKIIFTVNLQNFSSVVSLFS